MSAFAIFAAVWLRFDGVIPAHYQQNLMVYIPIAVFSVIAFGFITGAYNSMWAYIGFSEVFRQAFVAVLSALVFLFMKYTGMYQVSGSITVIYCGVVFGLTVGVRSFSRLARWYHAMRGLQKGEIKRVVVVGAGAAGAMLIKRLRDNAKDGIYPVAAVDDDTAKQGMQIVGIRVAGTIGDVARVAREHKADEIIIAVPSATSEEILAMYHKCQAAKLPIKVFQSVVKMESFFAGDRHALREISLEEILFRDSVRPDMREVFEFLEGKCVLVTGGAGSIGSEICRQVLSHGCKELVIFDFHENGLFEIGEELKERCGEERFHLCIGSVRDRTRLDVVFSQYKPDIVLHAAAHKHVPMMELNPFEAIKNNVFGTKNVLECCIAHHTKKCILISTDKAVNPTNIMGASKRMAELLMQAMNARGCEMAAVRFGNVLGSNGSVIPTFQRQIAAGGPVTVTHPDMKRYFMTIPEAVSLVLTAGALAHGGEIFVLDMGKPVRIYDLACDLIRMSGLEPERDIKIKITGLRPGEKLFEELSLSSESVDRTAHEKIFIMRARAPHAALLTAALSELEPIVEQQTDQALLYRKVFSLIDEKKYFS